VKVLCVIAGSAAVAAGDAEPALVLAALATRVEPPRIRVTRSTAILDITLIFTSAALRRFYSAVVLPANRNEARSRSLW